MSRSAEWMKDLIGNPMPRSKQSLFVLLSSMAFMKGNAQNISKFIVAPHLLNEDGSKTYCSRIINRCSSNDTLDEILGEDWRAEQYIEERGPQNVD